MMINKRLIGAVPESKRYIARNVGFQWLGLISSISMTLAIARLLEQLLQRAGDLGDLGLTCGAIVASAIVRWLCTVMSGRMSFLSSKAVKKTLRRNIYEKLLRLGPSYAQKVSTSEVVQVSTEGVEQWRPTSGPICPSSFTVCWRRSLYLWCCPLSA